MDLKKRIIFPIITAFLIASISLILVEAIARIFNLGGDYFFRHNDYIGYLHIPNRVGWATNPGEGSSVQVRINSLGLRDREYSLNKPPDTKRVLILGDSYAEAFQVNLEDSFQEILEKLLNKQANHIKYEVINGGVSGFGTDNELLFYRNLGKQFSPDLVVLTFVLNDVRENSFVFEKRYKGELSEPYFVLENNQLKLMNYPSIRRFERLRNFAVENIHSLFYLWRFLQFKHLKENAVNTIEGMPLQFEIFLPEYDNEWKEAWQVSDTLIMQLKREVESAGARFMVVMITQSVQLYPQHREVFFKEFPDMRNKQWDWQKPNRMISDFCQLHRIQFLDLLPGFKQYAATHGQPLHYPGGHWNKTGHKLAGNELYEFIRDNSLLK